MKFFKRTLAAAGISYGIPAEECLIGSKLRQIPGTPCSHCYADEVFKRTAKPAQHKRLDWIGNPKWVECNGRQIRSESLARSKEQQRPAMAPTIPAFKHQETNFRRKETQCKTIVPPKDS